MDNPALPLKISVKAVFRCEDEVLLYRRQEDNLRDIPGGHMEYGEQAEETLARELREELGFELHEKPDLLYTWTYTKPDLQRVYIAYLIRLDQKHNFVSLEFPDSLEFVWLNEKAVRSEGLFPGIEGALLKALSTQFVKSI